VAAACAAHHGRKHLAERCRKSNSRLGKGAEAENTQLPYMGETEWGFTPFWVKPNKGLIT
jgi:hypothetical protein